MTRLLLLVALLSALCGCATTSLPPVTTANFAFEDDEKRLWTRCEEEERGIAKSDLLMHDKELEAYLNAVARKLQPAEVYKSIPFHVYILKNPYSNAFTFPNGNIYVHTGILARMDNEAQLATLLAHEMTHATHRHQVREFRGLLNKSAVFASTRSLLGGLPGVGELTTVLGEIGTAAAITGHSRDMEREADMEGIKLLVKAGYDPREAPKLFKHLKDEVEEEEQKEPFFFGSHPRLAERIESYEEFLNSSGGKAGGVDNAETFRKKVAGAVIENAFMDFRAGRFPQAGRGAEKYTKIRPRDARGYYLLGEIDRQKGDDGDAAEALKQFQKAVSVDPAYPDAHKRLGLLYFKEGKKSQAAKAFKAYLAKAPQAADRSYIEEYLSQCR